MCGALTVCASVGKKHDTPIRRPRWVHVNSNAVRQVDNMTAQGVHDINVGVAAVRTGRRAEAHEHNRWRPTGPCTFAARKEKKESGGTEDNRATDHRSRSEWKHDSHCRLLHSSPVRDRSSRDPMQPFVQPLRLTS